MPKKKMPPPLSDGQLEIMEVVWDRAEVTVTDVWHELQSSREIARTTVQTTMLRLDERGWLKHRSEGKTFLFSAGHPRGASQRQIVRRIVDTAFQGSADGLVMTLLEERGISDEQAERIRAIIAEAEAEAKAQSKGETR
jgi:BlaI family penicillinase repressor